jgi:hypothetical protein
MIMKKKSLTLVLLLFFASICTVDGLGTDKKAKSIWEKYHSKAQSTNDQNKRRKKGPGKKFSHLKNQRISYKIRL